MLESCDPKKQSKLSIKDEKTLVNIYNQYYIFFILIARNYVHSLEEAEDLLGATMLKILEKKRWEEGEIKNGYGWIRKQIMNRGLSESSTQKRRTLLNENYIQEETVYLHDSHDAKLIADCIWKIPNQEYRMIIELHSIGYKNAEIALKIHRTTDWVRRRKSDAIKMLKSILIDHGIISSP